MLHSLKCEWFRLDSNRWRFQAMMQLPVSKYHRIDFYSQELDILSPQRPPDPFRRNINWNAFVAQIFGNQSYLRCDSSKWTYYFRSYCSCIAAVTCNFFTAQQLNGIFSDCHDFFFWKDGKMSPYLFNWTHNFWHRTIERVFNKTLKFAAQNCVKIIVMCMRVV